MDWLKKIDFAMTTDTGKVTFTFVLFAMILGFIISWIAIYCNKKIMGAFARARLMRKAQKLLPNWSRKIMFPQ